MAGIIKARIDVSKLPKEKFYKGKKGVYYEFIVSVNDETNLGNGEVVWTNDMIKLAKKEATQEEPVTNDLPF